MNKLFDNPKGAVIGIVIVLLLFFAYKAKATEAEIGPTYSGEFNGGAGLIVTERIFDNKIDFGIALISEQDFDKENLRLDNNGTVFAAFVATKPDKWWKGFPTEVHLGPAYWIHTSRFIGDELGFMLALKWHIGKHQTINIRHWSNAGTTKPNHGQDLLTWGWRF